MEFELTIHVAERFHQRYVPELDEDDARALLCARLAEAGPIREKPIGATGGECWRITDPDAIIVVKRERGRLVAVTVLPPREEVGPEQWELEEALRLAESDLRLVTERERADSPSPSIHRVRLVLDVEYRAPTRGKLVDAVRRLVEGQVRKGATFAGAEVRRVRVSDVEPGPKIGPTDPDPAP